MAKEPFHTPPGAKLTIGSVDCTDFYVEAQYNPKELQFAKQVGWDPGTFVDGAALDGSKLMHYTGAQPRVLTLELLFDGYETGESVEYVVDNLEMLASARDPLSSDPAWRRPHRCVVTWGQGERGMARPFRCVIESVTSKFTMFDSGGMPLRAVCTVTLKEADIVDMGTKEDKSAGCDGYSAASPAPAVRRKAS